jgi:hypothetical protein
MLKVPLIRFNARFDTSITDRRMSSKIEVVAGSLTGIHREVPLRCQQELHTHGVLEFPQIKIQKIQVR